MRWGTTAALVIGVAAVIAAVVYAGAGAVAHAITGLRISGLAVLALLHLPVVVLMGLAWWFAAGAHPPASRARFVWARFIRDAAGELLPFLHLGGVAFGVRALGRGRALLVGAASASIDGIIELTAKLPYVLAALLALLALAPQSRLSRPLALALAATAVFVLILLLNRRFISASLEAMLWAVRGRWPVLLSLDDSEASEGVRACFDRILSRPMRLGWSLALHLLCWFLGAAETWVTFRLLGIDLGPWQALAIDGTVLGLRTFGWMVPAAAGVQEGSYLLAAAVFGISPAAALAASFARRARDLLLGVGVLAIAFFGDAGFSPLTLTALIERQRSRAR
ncbi:MAG TPA: lysylphosphatidylglycerol synthase domain-containing protein [Steroidobacteraceae bacterium]|nr:lysylphosphatidylglycerol synthase domain-containing protein [Steroidobacteraceae bacterium]